MSTGVLQQMKILSILKRCAVAESNKVRFMNMMYCAFLRGVNVNGRTMKMAEVCEVFHAAGMEQVSSVLASGNIIFRTSAPAAELRGKLERVMSEHYSCDMSIFIKNTSEIMSMLESSPFDPDPDRHIYAFICERNFESVLAEEFAKITAVPHEAAAIQNGTFYWQVPKGSTLDAGFSKILGRKDMKEKFTSRNMSTIQKIVDKITH
jgi:uncharacterized protein (DUF1697 family)